METAADFVTEVPCVMVIPPLITIVLIIWSVVWIALAFYVFSVGKFVPSESGLFIGTIERTK